MSFIPKTPLNPEYLNFVLPGINGRSKAAAENLLKRNHDNFHIFFNDKGFHNHLTHHLLAAYSMGANGKRLEEIYERHASYQRPAPPKLDQPLTRETYLEKLGDGDAYTSFLQLFETEIEQHGIFDTIRRWVWSGDMLARLVGGAFHPLIHVGYGLEFDIPSQVAEGLALMACTENRFSPWVSDNPALRDTIPTVPKVSAHPGEQCDEGNDDSDKNILINILDSVRKDSVFDNVVTLEEENKFSKVFSQRHAIDRLGDYANQWKHSKKWATRQDVNRRVKELYTTAVVAYASTGLPEEEDAPDVQLDFFLMHSLTSSYFVHILASHLLPEEAASLCQAHWFASLASYVTVGRPMARLDRLLSYVSPNFKGIDAKQPHRHWMRLLEETVEEEEHVTKAIRACAQAHILYNGDPNWFDDRVYLKAAQMTYDLHGKWTFFLGLRN